jgi:lycopene beta-cyclase
MRYDYIIAGSGCAGLSLLFKILKEPGLREKKILVVDKESKNTNDRTWCYWEKGEGTFEEIVLHAWSNLEFKTETFVNAFELKDYKYKMIRGIDFYKYVLNYVSNFANVDFVTESIKRFEVSENQAILETDKAQYRANYLFNSTSLLNPNFSKENTLLQHFTGWVIETNEPHFNPKIGTLMDFSLSQKHGTTFMYVLPVSSKKALVEYTLFTGELLDKEEYRSELKAYIQKKLSLSSYQILEEEYGVIPMSVQNFSTHYKNRVINIGTAGGYTKASSGYTFRFIQNHTDKIINRLKQNGNPLIRPSFRDKMFQWYDRTLVEVILSERMTGKEIFGRMFKKVPPELILKFLANESDLSDDLKVMWSLPISKFLPAGVTQLVQ